MREARPFLKLSAELPESSGFTYAAVCPERRSLYAQCSDNIIYTFDINAYVDKPGALRQGLCSITNSVASHSWLFLVSIRWSI